MIDPSARHNSIKEEAEKRISELKLIHPEDYFTLSEYRKLTEEIRQANHHIEHVERMKNFGVKF